MGWSGVNEAAPVDPVDRIISGSLGTNGLRCALELTDLSWSVGHLVWNEGLADRVERSDGMKGCARATDIFCLDRAGGPARRCARLDIHLRLGSFMELLACKVRAIIGRPGGNATRGTEVEASLHSRH